MSNISCPGRVAWPFLASSNPLRNGAWNIQREQTTLAKILLRFWQVRSEIRRLPEGAAIIWNGRSAVDVPPKTLRPAFARWPCFLPTEGQADTRAHISQ